MSTTRSLWRIATLVTILLMTHVQPRARADEPSAPAAPSAEKGHALAQRLCTNCHVIEPSADTTVPAGVPPFRAIANKPGQSGQHIMNVLVQPQHPMPDIHLTNAEILDIVAYLETLRTEPSIPPLLPPQKENSKPTYPEPS